MQETIPKLANSPALPKIFIIVLNWNGGEDTVACLSSLRGIQYPRFEVIVVDNGSADGSADVVASDFSEMFLIRTGENLGYAGGNNRGIAHALSEGADFIFLLNNDTVVDPGILRSFVAATHMFPDGGVYGAKIYNFHNPGILAHAGGQWQQEGMRFAHIGSGEEDGEEFAAVRECDYVTGCALFASAESFRSVGVLDENFFLTYEETDWCYRARAKGYRPLFIPEAKLWHKVSAAFGGTGSPLQKYFLARNRLLWGRKHLSLRDQMRLQWKSIMAIGKDILPRFVLGVQAASFTKRVAWSFRTWAMALKRNIEKPENLATLYGIRDYYFKRLGNCPDSVRQLNNVVEHSKQKKR